MTQNKHGLDRELDQAPSHELDRELGQAPIHELDRELVQAPNHEPNRKLDQAPILHSKQERLPLVTTIVRPTIPMSYVVGVPQVCALAVRDALADCGHKSDLLWPSSLTCDGATFHVSARAGYDDDGMYLTCELEYIGELPTGFTAELVDTHIVRRIAAWEHEIAAGRSKAGPLAAVLLELFDATPLLGKECVALGSTGHPLCSGHFVAIDVWGRATVRVADGSEREFAPEHARIVAANVSLS